MRSSAVIGTKTLPLDFVNMAGSHTYLKSVVVMNRIKFMLYFTLVHVLCQCRLNSTLRVSIENTYKLYLFFSRSVLLTKHVCHVYPNKFNPYV